MESQPISLIPKNKKVRFIMDLGDFTGVDMLDRFIFFLYDNQQLTLNFSSYCQVYLNNNPVTYDNRNDPDLLDDKSYTYDKYGDIVDDIYLRYSGLTRSDKLCFEFIFNQEYQSQYELKAEVELCPNGELSKPFRTSSELKKRER